MLQRLALGSSALLLALLAGVPQTTPPTDAPTYTSDGSLRLPANYREWIYLTSGIDMSYAASAPGAPPPTHSIFDNVFVNPSSYRRFLDTGTWPDGTSLVLEVRSAEDPISINKRGHTQSAEIRGVEVHVKDKGKWLFYDVTGKDPIGKVIPPPADCYTCHQDHAAVDTTFVQFYPTLLPLARQKNTLSPAYLKDLASPPAAK
jgi:Cytochrome P460